MTDQEYNELMRSRAALKGELDSGGVEDLSGDPGEGVVESKQTSAEDFNKARGQNPNAGKLDAAGDAAVVASGGNPYVAGAGRALKTVGMVDDAKRQSEQAKINAYNQKIMAQRSAIRNFFA